MQSADVQLEQTNPHTLRIVFSGEWTLHATLPKAIFLRSIVDLAPDLHSIAFDTEHLQRWDTRLLIFLQKIIASAEKKSIQVLFDGLPEGVLALLNLSQAVAEREGARRAAVDSSLMQGIGESITNKLHACQQVLEFVGEFSICFARFLGGKVPFRMVDFWEQLQDCGPRAMGIVSLISLLVGLILAFVGSIQLHMFGAEIFIANLVSLGMFREMGAMMTGVIMAGRSGATYAAQLGAMQANEEIDALKTMGISPMGYLVLPRTLALVIALPLLCIYSDMLGIIGGALVGIFMLDLMPIEYYNQTVGAVNFTHFAVGVFKAFVFGVLIALAGCMRGIQSGRSASAVGSATTSAVVTSIVLIVIADAILTLIYNALKI